MQLENKELSDEFTPGQYSFTRYLAELLKIIISQWSYG